MWPQGEADHDSSKHRMASSSSSKSSSSSSSPSPFTSAGVPPTPRRTMEEVWKDITLSAATPVLGAHGHQPRYHHPGDVAPNAAGATLTHFRGMILQDFLARPFRGSTPASQGGDMGRLRSPLVTLPPNPTTPRTVLCLNSGGDFQYVDAGVGRPRAGLADPWDHGHNRSHGTVRDRRHSSSSPLDSMGPTGFFSFCANRKRSPEKQQRQQLETSDGSGNDRRHKRMIKNRESAARSRARKQAYTNELEFEVNHLTEENQRLRRQHEELRARVAAQLLPTRRPLQRSSSAPF